MIEDDVRTMLRERAGDIATVPPRVLEGTARSRPRPRWLLAVAAAAVVLVVGATALVVRNVGNHSAPAGSCVTALPAAWRRAFPDTPPAPLNSYALAMTKTAVVTLVSYPQGNTVLIEPSNPRLVLRTATDTAVGAATVGADLVAVWVGLPGSGFENPTAPARVSAIYLFDLRTGTKTVVARPSSAVSLGDVAVLDGTIYWEVESTDNLMQNVPVFRPFVLAYDVASRQRHVVSDHATAQVTGTPLGVDCGSGSVSADLPDPVRQALTGDAVTDGDSYAAVEPDGIVWADRAGTVRGPIVQHAVLVPVLDGVAGPYVFFHVYDLSDETYVLDSRTGAVADLGVAAGALVTGSGQVALGNPVRTVDTADLPGLTC